MNFFQKLFKKIKDKKIERFAECKNTLKEFYNLSPFRPMPMTMGLEAMNAIYKKYGLRLIKKAEEEIFKPFYENIEVWVNQRKNGIY